MTDNIPRSPSPLRGVRVIDLTIWGQGPISTMMLADLGAEVIKIDDPVRGDPVRQQLAGYGVPLALDFGGELRSINFELYNRGKKHLTLNLKNEQGCQILRRLAKTADVLIHNFRAHVPERLGFSYEAVSAINPKIIYVWSSAFGSEGPDRDRPGLDIAGVARSALMMTLSSERGAPVYPVGALGDMMAATMTSYAAILGLYQRSQTGKGISIDVSQLGSLIWLQFITVATYLATGRVFEGLPRSQARNALFNIYKCQDERWICLGCTLSQRYWPAVCRVLELPDLRDDPRFVDEEARNENSHELVSLFDAAFARRSQREWLDKFADSDVIVSPVNSVPDLLDDEQVVTNEYVLPASHPWLPLAGLANLPLRFDGECLRPQPQAPAHGENTNEILTELGYSASDISAFRASGAI